MTTFNKRCALVDPSDNRYWREDNSGGVYCDFANNEDFSIAIWVRILQVGLDQVIMGKSDTGTVGYELSYSNGQFTLLLAGGGGTDAVIITVGAPGEFSEGLPHFLVCTWEGTAGNDAANARVYVDEVEQDGTGGTTRSVVQNDLSSSLSTTAQLQISGRASSVDNMQAAFWCFAMVYDVALSASDVSALYNNADPAVPFDVVTPDPIAFWPTEFDYFDRDFVGDENAKNVVANGDAGQTSTILDFSRSRLDLTGSNINDFTDFPADSPGGISNRSLEGVGGNERCVEGTNDPALQFDTPDAFSVSYWFKSSNVVTAIWVSKWDTGNSQGWLTGLSGSSEEVVFSIGDGAGGIAGRVSSGGSWHDGVWHHCVLTFEAADPDNIQNTDMEIWIDNSEVSVAGSDTFASLGSFDTTVPFEISGRDGGNLALQNNQHVSEVQVYDRKLSPSEISAIYNSGAPTYPADWFDPSLAPTGYWRPGEDFYTLQTTNLVQESIVPFGILEIGGGGGGASLQTFKMRGRDDGRSPGNDYITWLFTGVVPDFSGTGFAGGTPTPIGSLIPGSVVSVDVLG